MEAAWNLHIEEEEKHIEKIEKIQRAVTNWIPRLRDLNYEEKLDKSN